jgi:hypothetical protein
VLNFAQHVIRNAARLWTEFSSDQKQRLQKVLFIQGVTFADGIYKTTETCLIFKLLQESEAGKTSLATLPGIESGGSVSQCVVICGQHHCKHMLITTFLNITS